jgi:prevent-host-death family protein
MILTAPNRSIILVYIEAYMSNEAVTIGAYEAKVHFSQILEQVTGGIPYIITKRGKPIVKLVPVDEGEVSFKELAAKAKLVRDRIKAAAGTIDVRAYINEGRK